VEPPYSQLQVQHGDFMQ